ncbi:MAG: hypothetical protein RMM98_18390, partial [Acidobacteriota bacterium]|nr:hypothetical protein [Acidobacteriota bacterium]
MSSTIAEIRNLAKNIGGIPFGDVVKPGTHASQYYVRKESFGLCGQVAVAAILRGSGKGVTADQVVEDYLDAVQKGLIYDKSPADP